jgi:DNA-binding CsgD family transcriptional regulator
MMLDFIQERAKHPNFFHERLLPTHRVKISMRGAVQYLRAAHEHSPAMFTPLDALAAAESDCELLIEQEVIARGTQISRDTLTACFGLTLRETANKLGISVFTLRRACRTHGIAKWPRMQRKTSAKNTPTKRMRRGSESRD